MSWHIKSIGKRPDVARVVKDYSSLPLVIKDAILAVIGDITRDSTDSVRLETYGHFGGGSSNIAKLEIEPFNAATPTAPVS